MRDRLLRQVVSRLRRFEAGQDPATVLAPEALTELRALWETMPDPVTDLPVLQVAGWLFWFRHRCLGPGEDQQDLTAALTLLASVYRAQPQAVPAQVRAYFDQNPDASELIQAEAAQAAGLLEHTMRTGDPAALNTAIGLLHHAVTATGHPGHAEHLSTLGAALRIRFERTGDLADLTTAVTTGQRAVKATPMDSPNRAGHLSNLGLALQTRFERTGDLADLTAAIDTIQNATTTTPTDHPDHGMYQSNLGNALMTRFVRIGLSADLTTAITHFQNATTTTPTDHPNHAMYQSNLGNALRMRFERTGSLADLTAAIDTGREAVKATPTDHPGRAGRLSYLGLALRMRFERTGDLTDLTAAIDTGREAVKATPTDHPDRAGHLSNLGGALRIRFERSGDFADLTAAIAHLKRAVAATSIDHPDHAMYQSNLGAALQTGFERTGSLADLTAAIDTGREAVKATPTDHPDRAGYLSNLGLTLGIRFEHTGDLADLTSAINTGREAAGMVGAAPWVRVRAATGWGRVAAHGQRWDEAVTGFTAAAELTGQLAPRGLDRPDQEDLLTELGNLGADAAVCCIHAGQPARAVELFEAGRGVLLGQALDTRTDLTALTAQHPTLAETFTRLRDELDQADPPPLTPAGADRSTTTSTDEGRRRQAAGAAFDELIDQIRTQPGFEGFLRPPPISELAAAATAGPVVVVAVSAFGSHALLLSRTTTEDDVHGQVRALPLPGLTPQAVHDQVLMFLTALGTRREDKLGQVLGWLWDQLAGLVLDELGLTARPTAGKAWPRVWWCTSGLLSFLPLHAAGRHHTRHDPVPATVLDRVVSSATPTLRALIHTRTRMQEQVSLTGGGRLVAVAMPRTPDAPDLPGVHDETTRLQERFPGQVDLLTGPQATRAAVLTTLPTGRWAHFACHGAADLTDPSHGQLLLHDHQDRTLTVLDIAQLRLRGVQLAFLSACETARPSGRLTDEAIHLASAFQLAGYPHVIATLWPISDRYAPDLADAIYTALTAGHNPAVAVHQAVTDLRDFDHRRPSLWASHLHTGP